MASAGCCSLKGEIDSAFIRRNLCSYAEQKRKVVINLNIRLI